MSNSRAPVWAVVPASGTGSRMNSQVPKQYLSFCGKTILEHTLDRLLSHPDIDGMVLVLREDDDAWCNLGYQSQKPIVTVTGGRERLNSVINGLHELLQIDQKNVLACVHDAARPLVKHHDISKVIEAARNNDAGALLAIPITDTIKRANQAGNVQATVSRSGLWRALTPQVFDARLLARALTEIVEASLHVTDEASAIESTGSNPKLVLGSADNIKITTQEDLVLAEHIFKSQNKSTVHIQGN